MNLFKQREEKKLHLLPLWAFACDRTGVSDRTAAHITSAILQDIGIIHEENMEEVVDRSKIRRERKGIRKKVVTSTERAREGNSPICIFFDGKRDKTLNNMVKKGNKNVKVEVVEDHITILKKPESIYLGHLTATSGRDNK